ncbi:zinc ribbon domain-containing protein [Candidatus Bathyarchaeota archaeon]|nr:zinc ribbon domain-containing protein [Candidatus Bathyarchaeota archaeon]
MPETVCPRCGEKAPENAVFCTNCGYNLKGDAPPQPTPGPAPETTPVPAPAPAVKRGITEHLSVAVNVASSQPMVFVPAILSGLISGGLGLYNYEGMGTTATLIALAAAILSFILNFASIDMSRDAYTKTPLDLGGSVSYVTGRILPFILAAILGGLMAITIVLIPVVVLMFVIMVMDEAGIGASISKSLSVLGSDLGDVILIVLVSIVGSVAIAFVPFISGLLDAMLTVVISLAFIDVYANYKQQHPQE